MKKNAVAPSRYPLASRCTDARERVYICNIYDAMKADGIPRDGYNTIVYSNGSELCAARYYIIIHTILYLAPLLYTYILQHIILKLYRLCNSSYTLYDSRPACSAIVFFSDCAILNMCSTRSFIRKIDEEEILLNAFMLL